jgi:hypothetical protein
MRSLFSFPNPVNEAAARVVALGVVVTSLAALVANTPWLLVPLTYGFLARVLTGPTLSPLGQFAVRVAAPRMAHSRFHSWVRFVPGPPKRFAQAMGVAFTVAACVLTVTVGWSVGRWMLVPLVVAASLEGFLAVCLGCLVFNRLMRLGLIPESVCDECGNITLRATRIPDPSNS